MLYSLSDRIKERRLAGCLVFLSFLFAAIPVRTETTPFFEAFSLSFDTTISVGGLYRLQNPDPDLVGLAHGGTQLSVNADDGNLNYEKGWVSRAAVVSHDLELHYRNHGLFVRGFYFYDYENMRADRARTPLTPEARSRVGRGAELLDAYVFTRFDAGEFPMGIRVGRQVLSWGESTFIQNGINVVNPVDIPTLRAPGTELREALIPVPMAQVSVGVSPSLTLEAFYQFRFEETELDPPGTYFSTNDIVGAGGESVFLGFGQVPDSTPFGFGVRIPRTDDRRPSHSGQFGLAARWLSPFFGNTELGFYFIQYHSRVPLISARTGSIAGAVAGDYAGSGGYFVEYPERIHLYGVSLNTDLSRTGISLQGDVSYRSGVPIQVDNVELLFAAMTPPALLGDPTAAFLSQINQIGAFGFEEEISGYRRKDMVQAQATATRIFGPAFGADQWLVLGEAGATYFRGMPDKEVFRFQAPGTFTSASAAATAAGVQPATTPLDTFADAFSWGYHTVVRLDYNNLFRGVNVMPLASFSHDVRGNTPLPVGNFLEGRRTFSFGFDATYGFAWQFEFRHSRFIGGGNANLLHDRDFLSCTLRYSF